MIIVHLSALLACTAKPSSSPATDSAVDARDVAVGPGVGDDGHMLDDGVDRGPTVDGGTDLQPVSPTDGGSTDLHDSATSPVCGDTRVEGQEECDGVVDNGFCTASCEIECNTDFADCNGVAGDGCEVNLQSDRDNCLVCGRSCGAPCSSGHCQPILLTYEPEEWFGLDDSLVLHEDELFFTGYYESIVDPTDTASFIARVPLIPWDRGGALGALLVRDQDAGRLRLWGDWAYFLDRFNGVLERKPLGSAPSEVVHDNMTNVRAYDIDAEHIYWSDPATDELKRMRKSDGTVETFLSGLDGPKSLALSTDEVYLLDFDDTANVSRLLRIAKSDGSFVELAQTEGHGPVVLDETHVFWMNRRPDVVSGSIESVSRQGGGVTTWKQFDANDGADFTVDADAVYWSVSQWVDMGLSSGVITRIPRDGAPEQIIISEQTFTDLGGTTLTPFAVAPLSPGSIVHDERWLYWFNEWSGHVFRIAK